MDARLLLLLQQPLLYTNPIVILPFFLELAVIQDAESV